MIEYLEKYYQLYIELENHNLPVEDYSKYQENFSKFINEFPELEFDSPNLASMLHNKLPLILSYIKKFSFQDTRLGEFVQAISTLDYQSIIQNTQQHFQEIIRIIEPQRDCPFSEKKRIYLGILWFLIGYYICYMIHQVIGFSSFPNLHLASQNKFLIFLTCCFIFYDDILDTDKLDTEEKKICISFTKFFFQYLAESPKKPPSMKKIESEFRKLETIDLNLDKSFKIFQQTRNILKVGLDAVIENYSELNLGEYQEKLKLMLLFQDLFLTEVKNSKMLKKSNLNQSENNITRENLIKITIEKSQKSIYLILSCLVTSREITETVTDLTYKFSFLSQLLDDLNDRETDIHEGNTTLFTQLNYQREIMITLKYIYYIRDFLSTRITDKNSIPYILISSNHYANLLVCNYALGKNNVICNLFPEYQMISKSDINKIRVLKLEYLKKLGNFSFK